MSKRRGLGQFADVRGGLARKRASVLGFFFFFLGGGVIIQNTPNVKRGMGDFKNWRDNFEMGG